MIGNQIANAYWEADLPNQLKKKMLDQMTRQEFLQKKYIEKTWVKDQLKNPVEFIKELSFKINK